ncbi:hypothetical protein [Caballeronia zhejiangensis]|uniref:hypothetical protein n=1 Tax=Caballeronia zhejiangensis TaxID=871203 RepID=UPI001F515D26|nr:hypothetical protein [Caballeronia zhejiangensis]MCI1046945.1 hypothetical protein [Caballeronia zhejiangensis]
MSFKLIETNNVIAHSVMGMPVRSVPGLTRLKIQVDSIEDCRQLYQWLAECFGDDKRDDNVLVSSRPSGWKLNTYVERTFTTPFDPETGALDTLRSHSQYTEMHSKQLIAELNCTDHIALQFKLTWC